MIDVAIIASIVPERFELMRRSLVTWQNSIRAAGLAPGVQAQIYLYVEGATLQEVFEHRPMAVECQVNATLERSGSHIAGYNFWLDRVEAKTYLLTHSEMLFPETTVKVAVETVKPDVFASFKTFWLPQYVTENLDAYNWQQPETLEQNDDIYRLDPKQKGEFYWNTEVRGTKVYESTTTYAMEHDTLQKMLPFPDFGVWGPDDPWHLRKRRELGIKTVTVMEPILFHQDHARLETLSQKELTDLAKKSLGEEQ